MRHLILGLILVLASAVSAAAQNTGGVFPPGFGDDHKSAQYRLGFNADTDRMAHRIHYQQSIDGNLLWRVVGQTRESTSSDFDFDFVQAELFWKLSKVKKPYQTGFRFDARLRDDNRPGQFGVNWMNQWDLGDGWQARLVGLSVLQVGDNSADGVGLSSRAQISKKLENGPSLGLQSFNSYGSTENFSLTKNGHTAGPFVGTNLGPIAVQARVLFGISDAAPDTDVALWVSRKF